MKNLVIFFTPCLLSLSAFAQTQSSTLNSSENSNPASNTQLNGTYSNSNNSNSGVNPAGNPGTITNAATVESSGTFQTPVNPNIEPGTTLTSGGAVIADPNPHYQNNAQNTRTGVVNVENPTIDSSARKPSNITDNPVLPVRTDFSARRIDSLQRENDRRQADLNANRRAAAAPTRTAPAHTSPARKVRRN